MKTKMPTSKATPTWVKKNVPPPGLPEAWYYSDAGREWLKEIVKEALAEFFQTTKYPNPLYFKTIVWPKGEFSDEK